MASSFRIMNCRSSSRESENTTVIFKKPNYLPEINYLFIWFAPFTCARPAVNKTLNFDNIQGYWGITGVLPLRPGHMLNLFPIVNRSGEPPHLTRFLLVIIIQIASRLTHATLLSRERV